MKLRLAVVAMLLLGAASAQAAALQPVPVPGCTSPGGLSRVSAPIGGPGGATCCGALPCQRQLSFQTVPPPRHTAHT